MNDVGLIASLVTIALCALAITRAIYRAVRYLEGLHATVAWLARIHHGQVGIDHRAPHARSGS